MRRLINRKLLRKNGRLMKIAHWILLVLLLFSLSSCDTVAQLLAYSNPDSYEYAYPYRYAAAHGYTHPDSHIHTGTNGYTPATTDLSPASTCTADRNLDQR